MTGVDYDAAGQLVATNSTFIGSLNGPPFGTLVGAFALDEFMEDITFVGQGCSPGFWKNNQPAPWSAEFPVDRTVGSTFDVSSFPSLSGDTLLQALSYKGGGTDIGAARILLRQAVAALENAASPSIDYPLTVEQVRTMVNASLTSGSRSNMTATAQVLDRYNNLPTCPLG